MNILVSFLPFLLLLICPVMMFFMHRKHDHSSTHNSEHVDHNNVSKSDFEVLKDQNEKMNHELMLLKQKIK